MRGLDFIPVRDANGLILCPGGREPQCQLVASDRDHEYVHCF